MRRKKKKRGNALDRLRVRSEVKEKKGPWTPSFFISRRREFVPGHVGEEKKNPAPLARGVGERGEGSGAVKRERKKKSASIRSSCLVSKRRKEARVTFV